MLKSGAEFSSCKTYRYALWRTWNIHLPRVMFIGLNPSTADEVVNDPTVRRCMSFAMSWGFGGINLGNVFAYRTSNPHKLAFVEDPIGPENDRWLLELSQQASIVVAAWGNYGDFQHRSEHVTKLFPELYCISRTKQDHPAHPLYLPCDLVPQKFIPNHI
ncbi:DUF1643 domain-containing protein [bacterium]|nr:DUF1643 domain-containing protein [bacterium]